MTAATIANPCLRCLAATWSLTHELGRALDGPAVLPGSACCTTRLACDHLARRHSFNCFKLKLATAPQRRPGPWARVVSVCNYLYFVLSVCICLPFFCLNVSLTNFYSLLGIFGTGTIPKSMSEREGFCFAVIMTQSIRLKARSTTSSADTLSR